MRTGNIVVGKIPEHTPEWMGDEDGLFDNGVWTYDVNQLPDMISRVVGSWMKNKVPELLYENMDKLNEAYTHDNYIKETESMMNDYVNNRIKEFEEVRSTINSKK